jgi:phosphoribosylformylglycinamidine cyclo-ligase
MPIGMALLEPTRLYVKPILELMQTVSLHGMAHVTGGGFYENIPRMFASRFDAVISNGSWTIPSIFSRIAYGMKGGNLTGDAAQTEGAKILAEDAELRQKLFNTFNMGIGFVLAVDKLDVKTCIEFLDKQGFPSWEIGKVETGNKEVRFV